MSIFTSVEQAPVDAILGLNEAFRNDPNPKKVNLGVGVYHDEEGRLPLLKCVHKVEEQLASEASPRNYLPITGIPAYNSAVQQLVFGAESDLIKDGRIVTVQGLGGTGAIKIGADFLHTLTPKVKVLISSPTWPNHRGIFSRAGFQVETYRYYDEINRQVDFAGMCADLKAAPSGTVVVLHACCHNPTGYDLSHAQWDKIATIIAARNLVPFIDMAYQGFGEGTEEDAYVPRTFAAKLPNVFVANSFSKSFSLYGERVGALSVICDDAEQASNVASQLKIAIRTNFSNPPTHGATLVERVLGNPSLYQSWQDELGQMRNRIKDMRSALLAGLEAEGVSGMEHIVRQVGMFSYLGLSPEQMALLRKKFGIYGTDTSRVCVASLNTSNIEYVSSALAAILKK